MKNLLNLLMFICLLSIGKISFHPRIFALKSNFFQTNMLKKLCTYIWYSITAITTKQILLLTMIVLFKKKLMSVFLLIKRINIK